MRLQLLNAVAQRHELHDLAKGVSHKIPVESCAYNMLIMDVRAEPDEGGQVMKELGLFNRNMRRIPKERMRNKGHEVSHGMRWARIAIVRYNVAITAIAVVAHMRDTENLISWSLLQLPYTLQQRLRLA